MPSRGTSGPIATADGAPLTDKNPDVAENPISDDLLVAGFETIREVY